MFDPNDLENSLLYAGAHQSGSYNQLQWSINPGNDYTDIISRIISVHEFLHNDLNNITGFGFLLQGYAYLSREESEHKKFYADTLHELIQTCTLAHEAYATWVGITIFKTHNEDQLETTVLKNNKEYQRYYHYAEHLAQNIKSIFLKQQVVSASIRFCFQSKKLAEYGIRNLGSFDPDAISPAEFPDNRFLYLTKQLPKGFFRGIINEHILAMVEGEQKELLKEALNGKENTSGLTSPGNDHLAEELSAMVYTTLQKHFDALGSPSLEDKEEHLNYFKEMLQELDRLCPFSRSVNPLFMNNTPDDHDRSILIGFENETVMLSAKPLSCIIMHPEDISETTRTEILNGVGQEPHLFVMARYRPFLNNQYQFMHKEDEEWFMNLNGFFTAIRYAGDHEGERMVIMIPFDEPGKLTNFLRQKNTGVPLLGCVSTSTAFHDDWWQTWGAFFTRDCTFCCVLADISPLYYIEKAFSRLTAISYSQITLKTPGTTYTAMLFQAKQESELNLVMLAPGSYVYCQALNYYITTRYPSYINEDFTHGMENYLPLIFSHIVREEHTWYYRSQNVNL